jgi:hypothetical protein
MVCCRISTVNANARIGPELRPAKGSGVDIDRNAPVQAVRSVDLAASPHAVWQVLVDLDRWPEWNQDIRSVAAPDGVCEGATFRWRSGPGTITSTFAVVDPDRELSWTGRSMSIRAVHVYRLEPTAAGTRVVLEESWSGLPARLLRRRSQATLETAIETGLARLSAEIDRDTDTAG